eukprot:Skav205102  [mRNA]  locus=scaffold2214:216325:216753:- [translate_table: standard]
MGFVHRTYHIEKDIVFSLARPSIFFLPSGSALVEQAAAKQRAPKIRPDTDAGHVPLAGAMIPPKRAVVSHTVKATLEALPVKI